MNKNLLILCDSTYGDVAKEIAESMQCFDKISILDVPLATTIRMKSILLKAQAMFLTMNLMQELLDMQQQHLTNPKTDWSGLKNWRMQILQSLR